MNSDRRALGIFDRAKPGLRVLACLMLSYLLTDAQALPEPQRPAHPVAANRDTARNAAHPGKNLVKKTSSGRKLRWSDLNASQRLALAPLASEWDTLDLIHRKKWLAIANRYPKMRPEDQQRIQARMRDWANLTPEQRRIARESFARAKRLDAQQKSAKWQQYQKLSDEQKKKLAATANRKKTVANLPRSLAKRNKSVTAHKPPSPPVAPPPVVPSTAGTPANSPPTDNRPADSSPALNAPPASNPPGPAAPELPRGRTP